MKILVFPFFFASSQHQNRSHEKNNIHNEIVLEIL